MVAIPAFRIELDTKKLEEANEKFGNIVTRFEGTLQQASAGKPEASTARKKVGRATGVGVAVGLTEETISQSNDLRELQNQLRTVTNSPDQLSVVLDRLFEIARDTRTDVSTTVDTFTRIARASEDLRLSQAELLQIVETTNRAIKTSSLNAEDAAAGLAEFEEGLAFGEFDAEKIRSIRNRIPKLVEAIKDGLGIESLEALLERAETDALNAEQVLNAIQTQQSVIENEFNELEPTIQDSEIRLKNSILEFFGKLGDTLRIDDLAAFLSGLPGDLFDFLSNIFSDTPDELRAQIADLYQPAERIIGGPNPVVRWT